MTCRESLIIMSSISITLAMISDYYKWIRWIFFLIGAFTLLYIWFTNGESK